jgi:hypothetical protein
LDVCNRIIKGNLIDKIRENIWINENKFN